jgi:histidinol phosphatase-like enzyme
LTCFIAKEDDGNRKPRTGMWKAFLSLNTGKEVDMKVSFFCGDAAGRDRGEGKKDFSDSD